MVHFVGFNDQEEQSIRHLVDRFRASEYRLGGLRQIEKLDQPGYDGKVIPSWIAGENRMEMTMYLSSISPFTVAHELAHVSDITVRHQDSLDNLSCQMPAHWHLAYKMSSEYYANRIACGYTDGNDCFRAFQSDAAGLMVSAKKKEWGPFMVYYALLLGILHGVDKMDLDPFKMLTPKAHIPVRVLKGMASFRRDAVAFFEGYLSQDEMAIAAAA